MSSAVWFYHNIQCVLVVKKRLFIVAELFENYIFSKKAPFRSRQAFRKLRLHYQNALDIMIKSLGRAHVSVATTKKNIGSW